MQKVNLNLIPGSVLPVINVSQYDEGRQFQLAVFNGAASYDLTGKTVMVDVQKTDGHGCEYGATDEVRGVPVVAVSGNVVTITTPQQMTACAGDCAGELKITDSTSTIGTLNFVLMCEPAPLNDGTIISDTELPAIIDAARSSAERAEDAAQDAEAAAAHYPYIGDDGYWYEWDVETEQFVKTNVSAAGRAPDITMTATADATSSSTPTVTVTKTGTDEEPNFALAFSGLKGAKGDTGPIGPTGDSQDVLEAVGWVGSNRLPPIVASASSGLTYTVNNDGSITVYKTSTTSGNLQISINIPVEVSGNYYYSASPSGGSNTTFDAYMWDSTKRKMQEWDGTTASDLDTDGNAHEVKIVSGHTVGMALRLYASYTTPAGGITFKPMISRNGGEYVPYHPTVQEELWDGEVAEPKNVLPLDISQIDSGLTVTVLRDANGLVTGVNVVKAATTDADKQVIIRVPSTVSGNYYFSGCPSGGAYGSTYYVYMRDLTTSHLCLKWDGVTDSNVDEGQGDEECQIVAGHSTRYYIRFKKGYTTPAGGITFYPMLSLYKGAYSPYYVPLKDVVPKKCDNTNIAPTEDGATASQNIAVNDLFIRGGALCICDQPISSGGSFTEGTNYHKTTLAAVIAALRA